MKTYQRLSASSIKATKPAARDIWLSDSDGARGHGTLLLRISPIGVRRFYYRYSRGNKRKTVPLGTYSRNRASGYLTLSQARETARVLATSLPSRKRLSPPAPPLPAAPKAIVETVSDGNSSSKLDEAASEVSRLTLLELCQAYVRSLERQGKQSAQDFRSVVKRHIAGSSLASQPASEVKDVEIVNLLRKVIQAGKGRTASKIRSLMHAAYAQALEAELDASASVEQIDRSIQNNPVANVKALPQFSKARERALSRAELREFWKRLQLRDEASSTIAMRVVRLSVLLGGQRCEQLVRVQLTRVSLDDETVLLLDAKGRRPVPRMHLLPLTPLAKEEVAWLWGHSRDVRSSFLFPSNVRGKSVNSGTVSKLVTDICRDMLKSGVAESQFQFSDLRRTIETTLASLNVSREHRAQLQSHGLSGVQEKHYDMWEYMPQKRQALMIWERFLCALLESK